MKRKEGETFDQYKRRRAADNAVTKAKLRGRLLHASASPVLMLAEQANEPAVLADIAAGRLRRVVRFTSPDGNQMVSAVTKGVTYRKPKVSA